MKRILTTIVLVIAALSLLVGPAVAGSLIRSKDVKNGSLAERDFNKKVKAKLNRPNLPGPTGPQGDAGTDGVDGTDGEDGTDGTDGAAGADGEDGSDGSDGEDGPRGLRGETGPQGQPGRDGRDSTVPGPQGPAGVSGHTIKSGELVLLVDGGPRTLTVGCPSGKVPTGGGYRVQSGEATATGSYPESTSWAVQFDSPGGAEVRLYVICITAP